MTSRLTKRFWVRLLCLRIIFSMIAPPQLLASDTLRVEQSSRVRAQMTAGLEESDEDREIRFLEKAEANPKDRIHWQQGGQWHTDNTNLAEALAGGPQRGGGLLSSDLLPAVRGAQYDIYLVDDSEIPEGVWRGPLGTLFLGRETTRRLATTREDRSKLSEAIRTEDISEIVRPIEIVPEQPSVDLIPLVPEVPTPAVETPPENPDASLDPAPASPALLPAPPAVVVQPPVVSVPSAADIVLEQPPIAVEPAPSAPSIAQQIKKALAEQVQRALQGYIGPNQTIYAFTDRYRNRVRVTSDRRDMTEDVVSAITFPRKGEGMPDLMVVLPPLPSRWIARNVMLNAGGVRAAEQHPLVLEISKLLNAENGEGLEYDRTVLDTLHQLLNDVSNDGRDLSTRLAPEEVRPYLEVVRLADSNQTRSFKIRYVVVDTLRAAAQDGQISIPAVRAILESYHDRLAEWPSAQWMVDQWLEGVSVVDREISIDAAIWVVDQIHIAVHEIETQQMLEGAPKEIVSRYYYDALRHARLQRLQELRNRCEEDDLTPGQIEQLDRQVIDFLSNVVQVEFEEATANVLAHSATEIQLDQQHASNVQLGVAGVLFLNPDHSARRFVEGGGSYALPLSFTGRFSSLVQQWYRPGDRIVFVYTSVSGQPNIEQIQTFFEDAASCAMLLEGHPEIHLGVATASGSLRIYRPVGISELSQRWDLKKAWEERYRRFRDAVETSLRTANPPSDPKKVLGWITDLGQRFPVRTVTMFEEALQGVPADVVGPWVSAMQARAKREVNIIGAARDPQEKDIRITDAAFRLIRLGSEQMASGAVSDLFVPVEVEGITTPQAGELEPAPKAEPQDPRNQKTDMETLIRDLVDRFMRGRSVDRAAVEAFALEWAPGQPDNRRRPVDFQKAWDARESAARQQQRQVADEARRAERARIAAEQEAAAERLRLEAAAEAQRQAEEEARVAAAEAEAERLRLEEEDRQRIAAEQEAERQRLAAEAEAERVRQETAAEEARQEAERQRVAAEAEAERLRLEEIERQRVEAEAEAERIRQEAAAEVLRLEQEQARIAVEQESAAEAARQATIAAQQVVQSEIAELARLMGNIITPMVTQHPRILLGTARMEELRQSIREEMHGRSRRRHEKMTDRANRKGKKSRDDRKRSDDPMAEWQGDLEAVEFEERLDASVPAEAVAVADEMVDVDPDLQGSVVNVLAAHIPADQIPELFRTVREQVVRTLKDRGVGVNEVLGLLREGSEFLGAGDRDEAQTFLVGYVVERLGSKAGLEEKIEQFQSQRAEAQIQFSDRARIVAPEMTATGLGPLLALGQPTSTILFVETQAQARLLLDSLKIGERNVMVTGSAPQAAHFEEAIRRLGSESVVYYVTDNGNPNFPLLPGRLEIQLMIPVNSQEILVQFNALDPVRIMDPEAAYAAIRSAKKLLSDA